MRIALFSDTYEEGYGGVTVYVRELSRFLINQGHTVKVFVWESDNLTEEDRKICETFPGMKVVKEVRGKIGIAPVSITSKAKKFAPDLIHNHSQYTMGWHAVAISKILKIPLINHHHTYLEKMTHYLPLILRRPESLASHSMKSYTRLFFNSGDMVITPTQAMKNYLKSVDVRKPIKVVPFGIDLTKFSRQDVERDDTFTFLYVGRFNKEKNIDLLLEYFKDFSNGKDVKLKLIGDGPEEERVKTFIVENDLKDKVEVSGWKKRKELPLHYSSAHCFITLSDSETFGITILEAMACGLPIIGANATSIPELIKDKTNGFLVDIENKSSVLNKMNLLYEDQNLQKIFSENSIKIAQRFDKRLIFKSLENIYFNLIKKFHV